MFCRVHGAFCSGINGRLIQVEADVSDGLPVFQIIGELAGEVREAAPRVRTALRNTGYRIPAKRITVNLSPADVRKTGTGFDLPISIAILCCLDYISHVVTEKKVLIGELSLNGEILPVRGVLPMVEQSAREGMEVCLVPEDNLDEALLVRGICVIGVRHLKDAVAALVKPRERLEEEQRRYSQRSFDSEDPVNPYPDFADMIGQQPLKRCGMIAAAGWHHLLIVGPPGTGKTMAARRIAGILPPMDREEQMEVTKIYSVAGKWKDRKKLMGLRPFRNPHHTISEKALIGGMASPRPGEVSLAHKGVLFLDELTEYKRSTLEAMREILEMRETVVNRLQEDCCFPADILLVAAMNPCPCGYYPDRRRCMCSSSQIRRYMGKLSHAFLDRMDLCISAQRMSSDALREDGYTSDFMREAVLKAVQIQEERFSGKGIRFNGQMEDDLIDEFCILDRETKRLMGEAYDRLHLSFRSCRKVLKVARTIADLERSEVIQAEHLAEALCYRYTEGVYGEFQDTDGFRP